jgi:nucleoside-diphosphate-sugar epimerase
VRVLAIGSEGNVGRPLVEYLKKAGDDVIEVDIKPGSRPGYLMADINHPLDLLEAFDTRPNLVYLMAAVVSRVTCEQASSVAVATNLGGLNNVIQMTKKAGAKLVYFSTSEVYGPTDGEMVETAIPRPNNRYGLTKYLGEQLVEYEVRTNGLKAVILRPFMFYSEDEDTGDHRSAMVRFAAHLSAGQPIEVHADTGRGWMHMDDAVDAIERASRLPVSAVVNIGHPNIVNTEILAHMVATRFKADRTLIHVVPQPDRMTAWKRPSLERQADLLHFEPKVGIEEGVSRVCDRFRM